jgi:HlyD family secretion protein
MKKHLKILVIVSSVVVAALAGIFILRPLLSRGDEIYYVTKPVAYADVSAEVKESGIVNPVIQVTVGSEVSGTVQTLTVDFNSVVKKGQILATLDPTIYQAEVDSAQANYRLEQATEDGASVNVGKMKSLLDMATLTRERDEPLLKQGLIDQTQMDIDRTAEDTSRQDYLASQAQVRITKAQLEVYAGALSQAQFSLSKTVIKSPYDGTIMLRNVDIGQTVASSTITPTMFILATNLTDMEVDTSVDEADVGPVVAGQAAQFTVPAFPNISFAGKVDQVRINPIIVANVATFDAVVHFHSADYRLLPGMTALVSIQVGHKTHVLTIPIAAVLYRPLTKGSSPGRPASQAPGGSTVGGGPPVLPVAGAPGSKITIWKLVDGRPSSLEVVLGLSDGKNLEITSSNVGEGDRIIVSQQRGVIKKKVTTSTEIVPQESS